MSLTTNRKNRTRIGISTYSYPYAFEARAAGTDAGMDAGKLLCRAEELGVSVVQIADNYPLHLLTDRQQEELALSAGRKGITLEIGMRGSRPGQLMQYLEIAERMNSGLLRVVVDSENDCPDPDEILRRLKSIRPELEKKGIILGIENHDRIRSGVLAEIMERADSPYTGIVLDTVNSFGCEEGTQQVLDHLAKYTVNFHMKDFEITRVQNSLGLLVTGTIAGEGRLPLREITERLGEEAKSDYTTVLELWMQPEDTMEKTLEKENCWVEQSIRNMKKILGETEGNYEKTQKEDQK